jgi:hypothetical protein
VRIFTPNIVYEIDSKNLIKEDNILKVFMRRGDHFNCPLEKGL